MKAHENPFCASAIARLRYRQTDEGRIALAEKAISLRPLCAVVGPEGTGKTTLLEDLEAPLRGMRQEIVWLRLTRASTVADRTAARAMLAELQAQQCCLLDGGEIFSCWEWWQLKGQIRRGSGLVIASLHKARSIPILHRTKADWAVVQDLVHELSGGEPGEDLERIAHQSFLAHAGNVREVFRACYWACARR